MSKLDQITIDGKRYNLVPAEKPTGAKPEKTGWELPAIGEHYYAISINGSLRNPCREGDFFDNSLIEACNSFTDRGLAEDIARASKLMRNLWRCMAEYNKVDLDWNSPLQNKWIIDFYDDKIYCLSKSSIQSFGETYFDTKETANRVIKEFEEDLLWYFKEFKPYATPKGGKL